MSIFANPFASIAGQKERLLNVVNTIGAAINPFDNKKVVANTSSKALNAVLSSAANSPYTTAAIVAFPTQIGGAVAKTVSKLPTAVKLVGGGAAILAAPAIATTPSLQTGIVKIAAGSTPESLLHTGAAATTAVKKPSVSAVKEALSNPFVDIALGVGAAFGIAKAVPAVQTYLNTKAMNDNTRAEQKTNNQGSNQLPTESNLPSKKELEAQGDLAKEQAKAQISIIEAQTKQQKEILKAQVEAQEKLVAISPNSTQSTAVVAASPKAAAAAAKPKKKAKKKKKASKPKKRKKVAKKAKSIKRKKKKKRK